jgi:hypothetical protein
MDAKWEIEIRLKSNFSDKNGCDIYVKLNKLNPSKGINFPLYSFMFV